MVLNTPLAAIKKRLFADVLQIGVLKNVAIFTRKHLHLSLFFYKVTRPVTLLKRDCNTDFFSVNIAKF